MSKCVDELMRDANYYIFKQKSKKNDKKALFLVRPALRCRIVDDLLNTIHGKDTNNRREFFASAEVILMCFYPFFLFSHHALISS